MHQATTERAEPWLAAQTQDTDTNLWHALVKTVSGGVPFVVALIDRGPLADQLIDARNVAPEGGPVQGNLPPRVLALNPCSPEEQLADHSQLAVAGRPVKGGAVAVDESNNKAASDED